jgi:hypothetical protein
MTTVELKRRHKIVLENILEQHREFNQMAARWQKRTANGMGPGDEQFGKWLAERGKEIVEETERELAYAKYLDSL